MALVWLTRDVCTKQERERYKRDYVTRSAKSEVDKYKIDWLVEIQETQRDEHETIRHQVSTI